MGEMMAGVAHELNNPLTAILGISDLMRERAADDSTRRQVEIVLKQARRAAGIVQNLLAFSRPSALASRKLRPEQAIKQVIEQQQASLRQKNVSIQLEAPEGLPSVEARPRLLQQVFVNLIVNAEQAITSKRDHGTLRVSVEAVDGKIAFVFADDGPGISPEILERIFDPFFTTKRPGGGTGLGLTICLAIVKEHGGTIEVQSSPDAGAEFRVILPASRHEASATSAAAPKGWASAPQASGALQGRSVYVVDDEESIREIVHEGLAARPADAVHRALFNTAFVLNVDARLRYHVRHVCPSCRASYLWIAARRLASSLRLAQSEILLRRRPSARALPAVPLGRY